MHPPGRPESRLFAGAFVTGAIIQVGMIALALSYLFAGDTPTTIARLLLWCGIGSVYAASAVIILWLLSRRRRDDDTVSLRLELSWPVRVISFVSTILASVIGVATAFQVLALSEDADVGRQIGVVGVWAMLLAWGFLHAGFAQIYEADYFSISPPPLHFPGTTHPGPVEFVYFAYTLGTSFAASDVEVRSTRVRWHVVTHSVLSFFFNGLIVVFALNTILQLGSPG